MLQSALRTATFVSGNSRNFSLAELQTVHQLERRTGHFSAQMARAVVPEPLLEALANNLRPLLTEFLDPESDRIGNGMVNIMGGLPTPTVTQFAQSTVRAAAILGI